MGSTQSRSTHNSISVFCAHGQNPQKCTFLSQPTNYFSTGGNCWYKFIYFHFFLFLTLHFWKYIESSHWVAVVHICRKEFLLKISNQFPSNILLFSFLDQKRFFYFFFISNLQHTLMVEHYIVKGNDQN